VASIKVEGSLHVVDHIADVDGGHRSVLRRKLVPPDRTSCSR
jgi:hypothetical protein